MTHRAFLSCLAVVVSGCTGPAGDAIEPGGRSVEELFHGGMTVIDLTHAVSAEAPFWPGPEVSPFSHDTLVANDDGSPRMAAYAVPEHFGTHFDAPVHGGSGLPSVDRVPTSDLFAPAVVLDVTARVIGNVDYAVTVADLQEWEAAHGEIPTGAVVLMRSGWPTRWDQGAAYYNLDAEGRLHFPGFGAEAARFLVDERDIVGIGVDTGSVDPGNAADFSVHGIVNGSGLYHLENLADLSALPEAGAYLIVAPIKIEGGSGGQVRVFGVIPPA